MLKPCFNFYLREIEEVELLDEKFLQLWKIKKVINKKEIYHFYIKLFSNENDNTINDNKYTDKFDKLLIFGSDDLQYLSAWVNVLKIIISEL